MGAILISRDTMALGFIYFDCARRIREDDFWWFCNAKFVGFGDEEFEHGGVQIDEVDEVDLDMSDDEDDNIDAEDVIFEGRCLPVFPKYADFALAGVSSKSNSFLVKTDEPEEQSDKDSLSETEKLDMFDNCDDINGLLHVVGVEHSDTGVCGCR